MVEKPFVRSTVEARQLIDLAQDRRLVLAVGLEYAFASYVHRLKQTMAESLPSVMRVDVEWHDVPCESRHDMQKTPDWTTNVVSDLYPHVLTMLTMLFGNQPLMLTSCLCTDGGCSATLELSHGHRRVSLSLSRIASLPLRRITLVSSTGEQLTLDFTQEPGTIVQDGVPARQHETWSEQTSPLWIEIGSFFREIQIRDGALPTLATRTIHFVGATEVAGVEVKRQQIGVVGRSLLAADPTGPSEEAIIALREHLLVPLMRHKLVASPKDTAGIERWTQAAYYVISKFASQPFTTQLDMISELRLDADCLIELNAALRECDFAQSLMLNRGHASKYWQNTIIPLAQSGAVAAARQNIYQYPFRIGLYPGPSCMFFCTFCGRNYGAKYRRESVPAGNRNIKAILETAPKSDDRRFYVSGGLEPLTNPEIGDVVRCATEQGFALSMYTNGLMLTPLLLTRQNGLWTLDVLRISMYGVDPETTYAVTRKENAFKQVVENATAFLKLRNAMRSPMKVGFNFVVLPGRTQQLLTLAEVIARINRDAGGERQLDFLTLREDYSLLAGEGITFEERSELIEILARFHERRLEADLCNLEVDFGYALESLNQGYVGPPLEMVTHQAMRPKGFPQISVVVDLLGDVYLYREAGFLDRPGAHRYIIGRTSPSRGLEDVIQAFVEVESGIEPQSGDTKFFDIFDHVVTKLLNQADADDTVGIPFSKGPLVARVYDPAAAECDRNVTLGHRTLGHPTLMVRSEQYT